MGTQLLPKGAQQPILSCNWNALVQAFLHSLDSVVEQSLQAPSANICRADNVFPVKIAALHRDLFPHLIRDSLGAPESTTQTSSRSVQSFLHGSRLWQKDRPRDRPHYSVCNNRPHLRSSEMQPNNKLCNIVMTDGTNQSHNINEIHNVHLYQSASFLNDRRTSRHNLQIQAV